MILDKNKLLKIELSLRNGSNEEQASALAGIPYRDWLSYRAKRETNEPHYLSDLQDQKLRIFPLAVNKIFKSLEKDDENYPLALEVLKLRDKEWHPKGQMDVTSGGQALNGGVIDPELEEVRQKFLKEVRDKI